MKIKLFFFILLGFLFSQDCTAVQSLYDNAAYLDANEKIKSLDVRDLSASDDSTVNYIFDGKFNVFSREFRTVRPSYTLAQVESDFSAISRYFPAFSQIGLDADVGVDALRQANRSVNFPLNHVFAPVEYAASVLASNKIVERQV